MANSIHKSPYGPMWPLGAVVVPTPGTPVCIMVNVDANNNSAPETVSTPDNPKRLAYSPACHKIFIQGYRQAANNAGMTPNTGNIYLMAAGVGGGAGNRTDAGAILFVIGPGGGATWPASEMDLDSVSPYKFFLDADNANDAGLVTLQI